MFRCSLVPLPQVLAIRADGFESPPSNEDIVTTPALSGPILTSATPWGPTTGQAVATAPAGVTFSQASGSSHAASLVIWASSSGNGARKRF